MRTLINMMLKRCKSRKGQGMAEYGLIIGLVAIALVSALSLLHDPITQIFDTVVAALGMGP